MRLYYEIALRSIRQAVVYRGAYVAGILTNAFFGAVFSFVWIGLYAGGGEMAGFTLQEALSYVWIGQSLISVGAAWVSRDIAPTIRTGDVVTDLFRPWSFYGYWLSRTLGERSINLLLRGSLTYLLGVLYFGARVPSPGDLLAFGAAIVLSMLVSFAVSFLVNLTAFWLVDNNGVMMLADVTIMFFSGFLLPLNFFPPALAFLARLLPFQAIAGLPALVFLGRIQGAALIETLLIQGFWAVVLTALGMLVLRRAVRRLVVQGG